MSFETNKNYSRVRQGPGLGSNEHEQAPLRNMDLTELKLEVAGFTVAFLLNLAF